MSAQDFKIGDLRHRIEIETITLTPDGQGGYSESWVSFAEVWARILPVNTKERLFSEQLQYQRTHKVLIRWLDGLNTTMRFKYANRVFQIKAFRRLDERRFFIEIDAEENVGT